MTPPLSIPGNPKAQITQLRRHGDRLDLHVEGLRASDVVLNEGPPAITAELLIRKGVPAMAPPKKPQKYAVKSHVPTSF